MMTLSIIALALAVIIQVYDAWSTITIIQGGGRELNPLVAWAIGRVGLAPAVIGLKAAVSLILGTMVWAWGYLWPVPVALSIVSVFYVRIFWNHNFKHDGI